MLSGIGRRGYVEFTVVLQISKYTPSFFKTRSIDGQPKLIPEVSKIHRVDRRATTRRTNRDAMLKRTRSRHTENTDIVLVV